MICNKNNSAYNITPFLEKRLLYAEAAPSGPAAASVPEASEAVLESNGFLTRTALWFGRRIKATIDFPGHALDHTWGATQGGVQILKGTYGWAYGNAAQTWEGAKIVGRTAGSIGLELSRIPLDPVRGLISNTREKYGRLFSKTDTTLKNFWWKKPAQLVNALASPGVGAIKGVGHLAFGKGPEDKNILQRYLETIRGNQERGIVGIVGGTRNLLYQTFIGGPIETQWPHLVFGLKAIIANTRNLAARGLDTGIPGIAVAAYSPWTVPIPGITENALPYLGAAATVYSEALTDALEARVKPAKPTNMPGYSSQNFPVPGLSFPPDTANDNSMQPRQQQRQQPPPDAAAA